MLGKKLYNPDGVHDLLFERCIAKRNLEAVLRKIFLIHGFMEIETPSIEFLEVFLTENHAIQEEVMFKLMDEKGRILALRPEMTIPAARVAATKLKEFTLPLKLSYLGTCYKYAGFGGGKQREFTQAGVEIMGDGDPFTDAQVIVTAVESLREIGMEDFTLELGQVEFFKGLMEEANISEDTAESIRQRIEKKDFFGLEEMLRGTGIREDIRKRLVSLPSCFGGKDMLQEVRMGELNPRSTAALDNLLEILSILEEFQVSRYVSVDLGMVSRLAYYTGIIFRGMTYGVGFSILTGGRYDRLCGELGRDMLATGFSLDIDMALTALFRNKDWKAGYPGLDGIVCFSTGCRRTGILVARALRSQGLRVELIGNRENFDGMKQYARERNTRGVIQVLGDDEVAFHDLDQGTCVRRTLRELQGGQE